MLKDALFHHIGVAVVSIDATKPFYTAMGYVVSETVIEPVQRVKVAYTQRINKMTEGNPTIELLEPLDEKSPIQNILKRNGNTPYHICYAVSDLSETIKEVRALGFLPLGKPIPGHGLGDALMVFLYNSNYGLVQIMEKK